MPVTVIFSFWHWCLKHCWRSGSAWICIHFGPDLNPSSECRSRSNPATLKTIAESFDLLLSAKLCSVHFYLFVAQFLNFRQIYQFLWIFVLFWLSFVTWGKIWKFCSRFHKYEIKITSRKFPDHDMKDITRNFAK